MGLADIRPEEDVDRLEQDVGQKRPLLQNSGFWRHRCQDGRVIDVEIVSHRIEFAGLPGVLVVAQDVSERLRASERAAQAARQQSAFAEIAGLALTGPSDYSLLQRAVEVISHCLGAERVCAYETAPDGRGLRLRGSAGSAIGGTAGAAEWLDLATIPGHSLRAPSAVIIDDLSNDREHADSAALRVDGLLSAVAVPIPGRSPDQPFGALAAFANRRGAFGEDAEGFVAVIASVVSTAIQRRRREHELQVLVEVAATLRGVSTRRETLTVVLDLTRRVLDVELAAIALVEPSTGEIVVLASAPDSSVADEVRLRPGEGITGRVIASGQPHVGHDLQDEWRSWPKPPSAALRAGACMPLLAGGATVGALWIIASGPISREQIRLLEAVSDVVASALHGATVLQTLEQRVAERTNELAEANSRLMELDRLKSKFVSDVSHELRTPVGNLVLHLDLLVRGRSDKREHYLDTLKDQAARLTSLVENILSLSHLEAVDRRTAFEPVDLNAVVGPIVSAQVPSAESAGVALVFQPDTALMRVRGDPKQLAQVVTNLVANAVRYTCAGHVHVRTVGAPGAGEVGLWVSDTGSGVSPEDKAHLFERFYRGRQPSDIPGSGLGLAISKEIVELHGGRIEVESELDVGSEFRVWLPAWMPGAE